MTTAHTFETERVQLNTWKADVVNIFPRAQFVRQSANCSASFTQEGDWTAVEGPGRSGRVVGIFVPNDFCRIEGPYGYHDQPAA